MSPHSLTSPHSMSLGLAAMLMRGGAGGSISSPTSPSASRPPGVLQPAFALLKSTSSPRWHPRRLRRAGRPRDKLQLSSSEKENVRKAIEDPALYKRRYSRLVLLRASKAIEEEASARWPERDEAAESITVEHILPQKPQQDSRWLREFSDEKERDELTHCCLGNLMLISGRKNSKAGTLDFMQKLQKYFRYDDGTLSSIKYPSSSIVLMSMTEWTPVRVRQRKAAHRCALRQQGVEPATTAALGTLGFL